VAENVSQFLSVFYPAGMQGKNTELLEHDRHGSPLANTKVKNLKWGPTNKAVAFGTPAVLAQKPEVLLFG